MKPAPFFLKRRKVPLLGFNRLQESGYNEEEIRDIRMQFHRLHGTLSLNEGEWLKLGFRERGEWPKGF